MAGQRRISRSQTPPRTSAEHEKTSRAHHSHQDRYDARVEKNRKKSKAKMKRKLFLAWHNLAKSKGTRGNQKSSSPQRRFQFSPPGRRVADPPRTSTKFLGRGMSAPRWMSTRGVHKNKEQGRWVFRAAVPPSVPKQQPFELLERMALDNVHHIGWEASGTGSGLIIKSPPLTLKLEERHRVHQFIPALALADADKTQRKPYDHWPSAMADAVKTKHSPQRNRSSSPSNASKKKAPTPPSSPPSSRTRRDDRSSDTSRSQTSGGTSRTSSPETRSSIKTGTTLCPGAKVRIHGLKAAAELNGQVGVLENFDTESDAPAKGKGFEMPSDPRLRKKWNNAAQAIQGAFRMMKRRRAARNRTGGGRPAAAKSRSSQLGLSKAGGPKQAGSRASITSPPKTGSRASITSPPKAGGRASITAPPKAGSRASLTLTAPPKAVPKQVGNRGSVMPPKAQPKLSVQGDTNVAKAKAGIRPSNSPRNR